MIKTAFIWRESVYKNNFHCGKCGERLAKQDGEPLGTTLFDEESETLWCPKCKDIVARITEVDMPEGAQGLQGNYEDYINAPVEDADE